MIVVAFLFPLAVYCFLLGLVNRRSRPLMLPATWDFVGVLFAASGLLIVSGPAMLSGFSEYWRTFWLLGRLPSGGLLGDDIDRWRALSVAYFALVVGLAIFVLWGRRRETAVYNIDTSVFEEVLLGVFEYLGLQWSRVGDRYFLRPVEPTTGKTTAANEANEGLWAAPAMLAAPRPVTRPDVRVAALTVDLAPVLHHVTLRWEPGSEEMRPLVEGELARALADVRTRENPVGGWLLASSTVLMAVTLGAMAFVTVVRVLHK